MSKTVRRNNVESLPLLKDWSATVRNAVLNVIGIVRIAMLVGREASIQEGDMKDARIHQLESDLAMTREELLFLPRVTAGKPAIHEKMLRPIAAEVDWAKQRETWHRLATNQ